MKISSNSYILKHQNIKYDPKQTRSKQEATEKETKADKWERPRE